VTEIKVSEIKKFISADKAVHLKEIMATNLKQMEMTINDGIKKGIFRKTDPMMGAIIMWNIWESSSKYQENRLDVGKKDYRKSTLDAGLDLLLWGMKKR